MSEYTRKNDRNIIALTVPGKLECRGLVLRTVAAACKLMLPQVRTGRADVTHHLVSAVGEAYNNIVLHGYAGREPGPIEILIDNSSEWMRIVIKDSGASFDPLHAPLPDLEALPESGLGVFIMRSLVDEMTYEAGETNVLTLFKRLDESSGDAINSTCPSPNTKR